LQHLKSGTLIINNEGIYKAPKTL